MEIKKKTKLMIIETAIKLFQKNGVSVVTVQDICDEAGIARSSFYYHFKTKEEILDHYFLTTELEIANHLLPLLTSKNSYEQFIQIYDIFMKRTTQAGPDVFGQIIKRNIDRKNRMLSPQDISMRELYISLIRDAQNHNHIRNMEDPEKLVELIVYLSDGIAVIWCSMNGSFDYSAKLREMIDLVLKPKDGVN